MSEWRTRILHGKAETILPTARAVSAHSLVCDPPGGIKFMGKKWDSNKGGRDPWIAWLRGIMEECHRILVPGAHGLVWAIPRTSHWTATALEDAGFEIRDVITHHFASGMPKTHNVARGIRDHFGTDTSESQQWDGWGTALKGATEHWILIRKPFPGTIAQNVLQHGAGGINVDACRVGDSPSPSAAMRARERVTGKSPGHPGEYTHTTNDRTSHETRVADRPGELLGLWPANLILSHSPDCDDDTCVPGCPVAEMGEKSSFFYCAKPSRREKEEGLLGKVPCYECGELDTEVHLDSRTLKDAFCVRNDHPTVKSVALMRWLVRLVTPKGEVCLDPFMGTGTTGIACLQEGIRFVGIEEDERSYQIASARLRFAEEQL